MDKYEFNIKVEQIKKLVNKGDYETAMKIADTIDWRRVRSTSLLTMVSQVYERNEEYQDAKDILLLAFERAPIGKGLLFKLTDLALREGNVPEAEAYYREFCDLSADDPRQSLLRYLILEAKGASLEQQINSLERYCEEELDEKWLYRLAVLYQEMGREDDCVKICDKIMLMFGLGKYVDKAMELKLQYAPLTKYQMDLVENREKYEEKLQAVEEKFNNGTYRAEEEEEYYDDPSEEELDGYGQRADEELAADLHEAEAEEDLAREVSKYEPYDEEPEDSAGGETRILDNIRDIKELRAASLAAAALEPGMEDGREEDTETTRLGAEAARYGVQFSGQAVGAQHGTQSIGSGGFGDDDDDETVIEDWDLEPDEGETYHLMIEAEDEGAGLSLALESLKKIHRELGTKNPVAKISGEKLNKKGIFAVADRLTGKDLIVERASDLDRITIGELIELMEKDETGIIVVLIDTPERMERLHGSYPSLAGKFQYIGCERTPGEDPEETRRKLTLREEEIRRQAARDAAEARRRQASAEEEERMALEREEEERARLAEYEAEEARRREEAEAERLQAEYEAENAVRLRAEREAEEARLQAEFEEQESRRHQLEEEEDQQRQLQYEADEEEGQYEEEDSEGRYEEDRYEDDDSEGGRYVNAQYEEGQYEMPEDSYEETPDDGHEMDVEEFAQYACKYAAEIDCSISGKSMLALYERAEMMEEDGIPLTKSSAEDLIEEAADKAEKRSFGGLFSSKYDKDGLLILKEKHFFD